MERRLEVTSDVVVFELGCRQEDGIDHHRDCRKAAPTLQNLTVQHYFDDTPKRNPLGFFAGFLCKELFADPGEGIHPVDIPLQEPDPDTRNPPESSFSQQFFSASRLFDRQTFRNHDERKRGCAPDP